MRTCMYTCSTVPRLLPSALLCHDCVVIFESSPSILFRIRHFVWDYEMFFCGVDVTITCMLHNSNRRNRELCQHPHTLAVFYEILECAHSNQNVSVLRKILKSG